MGYCTRVTGEIAINPPIPWAEFRNSPFADESEWLNVKLRVEVEDVDTDEGTLQRRTAVAIVPGSDDSYKAYDIETHLQQLVNEFGEGRTFTGMLEGEGEENDDMWRLKVRPDGSVVKIKPEIVWPE